MRTLTTSVLETLIEEGSLTWTPRERDGRAMSNTSFGVYSWTLDDRRNGLRVLDMWQPGGQWIVRGSDVMTSAEIKSIARVDDPKDVELPRHILDGLLKG